MCEEYPEEEWALIMPIAAWRRAKALEQYCAVNHLDSYSEACLRMQAAKCPTEKAIWNHVWDYEQCRMAAGKDDRFLILLQLDGEAPAT